MLAEALLHDAKRSMAIADLLLQTTNKLQHLTVAEDTAAAAAAEAGQAAAAASAAGAAGQRGPLTRMRRATRSAGSAPADAAPVAEGSSAAAYQAALKPLVVSHDSKCGSHLSFER